jgi:hypothetical protein
MKNKAESLCFHIFDSVGFVDEIKQHLAGFRKGCVLCILLPVFLLLAGPLTGRGLELGKIIDFFPETFGDKLLKLLHAPQLELMGKKFLIFTQIKKPFPTVKGSLSGSPGSASEFFQAAYAAKVHEDHRRKATRAVSSSASDSNLLLASQQLIRQNSVIFWSKCPKEYEKAHA